MDKNNATLKTSYKDIMENAKQLQSNSHTRKTISKRKILKTSLSEKKKEMGHQQKKKTGIEQEEQHDLAEEQERIY